MTTVKENYL